MRLSIIVTFFSEFDFVADAVNSVLAQALEGLEIIVVNDNPSESATGWLKKRFDHPQVRVIAMPANGGLSAARNYGVLHARGNYVGFLDADDYVLPGGLSRQLAFAESTGADMVHGQTVIGQPAKLRGALAGGDKGLLSRRGVLTGEERFTAGFRIFTSWASLYRHELFVRGLAFDSEQRRWEDRLFVIDALKCAHTLAVLAEPVRFWRKRGGSIMTSVPSIEDCRLKTQNFLKCTPKWFDADVADPHFWAAREFMRETKTMLLNRESMPWSRFFCGDADLRPLEDQVMMGASTWGFSQEDLRRAIAIDTYPLVKATSSIVVHPSECVDLANALITRDRDAARTVIEDVVARETNLLAAPSILVGAPPLANVRVSLHIGLHKTGSTFLQRTLSNNRHVLLSHGILFPEAGFGFAEGGRPTRQGGLPGHQRLLRSILNGTGEEVEKLADEVKRSGAGHVLISAENLSMPQANARIRAAKLYQFCSALQDPAKIRLLAVYRRPDVWLDSFYREVVTNGFDGAHQSFFEFLQNNRHLVDLKGFFRPLEAALGNRVKLIDYDRSRITDSFLADFLQAAGIPVELAEQMMEPADPVYPSLSNSQITTARLLCVMEPDISKRQDLLRAYFSMSSTAGSRLPFASADQRRAMISEFVASSAQFIAERAVNLAGAAPDLTNYSVEDDCAGATSDVTAEALDEFRALLLMREAEKWEKFDSVRVVKRKKRLRRLISLLSLSWAFGKSR